MRVAIVKAVRNRILQALFIVALAGSIGALLAAAQEQEKVEPAAKAAVATTTGKDQVDLAVTVYNSNLALVRDVRQIHLQSGIFPLHFEDVAASINPATVHFR